VMGSDVPDADIEAILATLGFAPRRMDSARNSADSPSAVWECTQPSWRQDVTRGVDLVEEVARHYGFDKFPARLPPARQPAARLPYADAEDRLRERLIGLGYREIVTIPLVNEAEDALFRLDGVVPVRVDNPLAEDAGLLRSNGLVSMVHALAWNVNRGQRYLRLFEIGRVYRWNGLEPAELRVLTIGATGLAREKSLFESAREFEFADLKGDLDQLGELAGGLGWVAGKPEAWQHPAQAGFVSLARTGVQPIDAPDGHRYPKNVGTSVIGLAAKVAPQLADRFKLRQSIFLGGFWLDPFYAAVEASAGERHYQPLSRFPAVERDFSLTLNDGTTFAAVRQTIAALGISVITSIDAVDLFRGKNVPTGKFSLLVRVTFQSLQVTLTETEVGEFSSRIVVALEAQLGASLRGS
jgi:phenylalanyl-tRNA synthetase beta chain